MLTEALGELGEACLLLLQVGIAQLSVSQIVSRSTVHWLQRQNRKGLSDAFCGLPLSQSIDERVERDPRTCYPVATIMVFHIRPGSHAIRLPGQSTWR